MDVISLRTGELSVSQFGFGCCPLGGHGWGNFDLQDAERSIVEALDHGVSLFDTADVYGLGLSEERLGRALRGRRDKAIIATKFGVRVEGRTFYDNSIEWLEQSLEGSLKRLQTDVIDIYQVHELDGVTPSEAVIEALERKREEGKIRFYGFSNANHLLMEMNEFPPGLVSFQVEYSLIRRDHEHSIEALGRRQNLLFLSWGSLGQGMLSGAYDRNAVFPENDRRSRPTYINFHGVRWEKCHDVVDVLRDLAATYGKLPGDVAVRWILDRLAGKTSVLVGVKSTEQLRRNLNAYGWTLAPEHIAELDRISEFSKAQANLPEGG